MIIFKLYFLPETKRMAMSFLYLHTLHIYHLQLIKEHSNVSGLITPVKVQTSILEYRNICESMGKKTSWANQF